MNVSLKLRASEQQDSPLMQLPFEIRTMILRLLLVHDGPLRGRKQQDTEQLERTPYNRWERVARQSNEELCRPYKLNPALLATCQRMFEEGTSLLYDCNTIGLQFNARGVILYAIPDKMVRRWDQDAQVHFIDAWVVELLSRFDKIHIDVDCRWVDDLEINMTILHMSEILRDKHVQVQFLNTDCGDFYWTDPEVVMQDQLDFFQLTRCKAFEVLHASSTELDASKVSAVVDVVTSLSPIVNLWPSLHDFREYRVSTSRYLNPNWGDEHHYFFDDDRWSELEDAAKEYDAARFRKVRASWMEEIENEMRAKAAIVFRQDELHNLT